MIEVSAFLRAIILLISTFVVDIIDISDVIIFLGIYIYIYLIVLKQGILLYNHYDTANQRKNLYITNIKYDRYVL